jgi:hypothetical protein
MIIPSKNLSASICVATFALLFSTYAMAADGQPWRIGKSTGEVWVTHGDTRQVSLGTNTDLQAGDNVRTGPNGRVMLVRGEERIAISPNSAIGISALNSQYPTTISQQAGSIVLEVEKKNVQHFEVETPFLAAVVKGTHFRVSVDRKGARVDVLRGQVEVADFKSGETALVLPGQAARVRALGNFGLTLSGSGKLNPVEKGVPRRTSVQALFVPKTGLRAPRAIPNAAKEAFAKASPVQQLSHGVHIGAPLGEVRLDITKVTKGLAHSNNDARLSAIRAQKDIGGSSSGGSVLGATDASGTQTGLGSSSGGVGGLGGGNSAGGNSSAAAGAGNGGGNGNGNAGGNGNGKAKGHSKS